MRRSLPILALAAGLFGCIDLPTDLVDQGALDQQIDGAPVDMTTDADRGDMTAPDMAPVDCATPFSALSRLGSSGRFGQPSVADVDADGYRDLIVPTEEGGQGLIRVAFGGPCGLDRMREWPTAERPWRAVFGRFDGVTPTLTTVEQGETRWSVRAYPLDDPADVWSWQIPPLPLGDESFLSDLPLPMLAADLDGEPGEELLVGSFYYLFSLAGPRVGPPSLIEPLGESPTYGAQDLTRLTNGQVFMLESHQWRLFDWNLDLGRLDGGTIERAPAGSDTYRALAHGRGPDGVVMAGGYALEGRLFDLFQETGEGVDAIGYRYDAATPGLVHGLAVGDLRARGATDAVILIHPEGGNPLTDEAVLTGCADAILGNCSGWYDQRVAPPFPLMISADFDSPIGTPSAHELLLYREGEAELECWRFDQIDFIDKFTACD